VRIAALFVLAAAVAAAGTEARFLLRELKGYNPLELSRKEEKSLREEAQRRARSRYGSDFAHYVPELYEHERVTFLRRRLDERGKKHSLALQTLGAPDHSTATEELCRVFEALVTARTRLDSRRDDLKKEYEKIVVSEPGAARLKYQDGLEPRAEAIRTERALMREQAYHLLGLQMECGTLLTAQGSEDSVLYMTRTALKKSKEPRLRVKLARILSGRPETRPGVLLGAIAREKEPGVRAAYVACLGRMGDRARDAVERIAALLEDPDVRVRVAAARTLARLHVPEAVEPLVLRLGKETGRARLDLSRALESLTAERFGSDPDSWTRWWAEHGDTVLHEGLPPPGGKKGDKRARRWKGEGGTYYGLPQVSERIVYILDISDSMNFFASGEKRIDRCKREIISAIGRLPKSARFSVIAYNDQVHPWRDKLVPATKSNRESAQAFIEGLRGTQSTNIYDALRVAFQLGSVDTFFLLSDGAPTKPDATLDDVDRILAACRDWNALGRVTIHTIGIGKGLKFSFLIRLAEEHEGKFIRRNW